MASLTLNEILLLCSQRFQKYSKKNKTKKTHGEKIYINKNPTDKKKPNSNQTNMPNFGMCLILRISLVIWLGKILKRFKLNSLQTKNQTYNIHVFYKVI